MILVYVVKFENALCFELVIIINYRVNIIIIRDNIYENLDDTFFLLLTDKKGSILKKSIFSKYLSSVFL